MPNDQNRNSENSHPSLLVLGIDSQLGAELAVRARIEGYMVRGTSRRRQDAVEQHYVLDLATPDFSAIAESFDFVVICASMTSMAQCEADPAMCEQINLTSTIAAIDHFARRGSFVVFLSSNAVFDGRKAFVGVDEPVNPQSRYGHLKARVEQHMAATWPDSTATLRLTKVLTPRTFFIERWQADRVAGGSIRAFTDALFCPVPSARVIDAILRLLAGRSSGLYQLSGDEEISFYQFALNYFKNDPVALSQIKPEPSQSSSPGLHNSLTTHLP